mmetsp:Transcript_32830/g.102450  ORF Transcript_32830/g.102450 Transcript_32830/m.102450 type:complete len:216 (-) Transcript_32830:431-1078(-)
MPGQHLLAPPCALNGAPAEGGRRGHQDSAWLGLDVAAFLDVGPRTELLLRHRPRLARGRKSAAPCGARVPAHTRHQGVHQRLLRWLGQQRPAAAASRHPHDAVRGRRRLRHGTPAPRARRQPQHGWGDALARCGVLRVSRGRRAAVGAPCRSERDEPERPDAAPRRLPQDALCLHRVASAGGRGTSRTGCRPAAPRCCRSVAGGVRKNGRTQPHL